MQGANVAGTKEEKIEIITLTDVFEKYVPPDQIVHFLKIDVEGFEEQCIRGLNLEMYKPWIFCIECLPTESCEGYEPILKENGYVYTHFDGQNRYYVLEEKSEVVERFQEIGRLDEFYEIVSFQDATKWLSYEQSTSWKITAPLRRIARFIAAFKK